MKNITLNSSMLIIIIIVIVMWECRSNNKKREIKVHPPLLLPLRLLVLLEIRAVQIKMLKQNGREELQEFSHYLLSWVSLRLLFMRYLKCIKISRRSAF